MSYSRAGPKRRVEAGRSTHTRTHVGVKSCNATFARQNEWAVNRPSAQSSPATGPACLRFPRTRRAAVAALPHSNVVEGLEDLDGRHYRNGSVSIMAGSVASWSIFRDHRQATVRREGNGNIAVKKPESRMVIGLRGGIEERGSESGKAE